MDNIRDNSKGRQSIEGFKRKCKEIEIYKNNK